MALRLDDRYIWLGFGVFFIAAFYGIRYAITDILDLTKVELAKAEDTSEQSEKPENAIDLNILRTLATSPNPNIANAVKTFIIQRFTEDEQAKVLHDAGLISNDVQVRRRAEMLNQYLTNFDAGDSNGDPGAGYEYALRARQRAQRALGLPDTTNTTTGPRTEHQNAFPWSDGNDGDVTEITTPDSASPEYVSIEGISRPVRVYPPLPIDPYSGWTDILREERGVSPGREDAMDARRRRREAMVVHDGAEDDD